MFGILVTLYMLFESYLEPTKNWSLELTASLQDPIPAMFFCFYCYFYSWGRCKNPLMANWGLKSPVSVEKKKKKEETLLY